ncbi:MAG: DNA recombination protein RmuC [Planctomycetota bacterium]|nr:DNA recombination protein RmuC [Planctomycetota bacterium]
MEWIALAGGIVIGFACAWFIATGLARSKSEAVLRELEGRARGAEARIEETRKQLETVGTERAALQTQLTEAQVTRSAAETRAVETAQRLCEEKALLEEAKARLSDAFKTLAAEALDHSKADFLTLANEKFSSLHTAARTEMEERQKSLESVVKPLKESLDKLELQNQAIEKSRGEAYGSLVAQVKAAADANQRLQQETHNLTTALRSPTVRGRWGEWQLRRLVELAGMQERCDFSLQTTVTTDEDKRLRPDMVVHLPGGKNIVVDAKTPLQSYLDAVEAQSEEQRVAKLKDHARQVRAHMEKLAQKSYWEQFEHTPEITVLFLPGEAFFSAALEHDHELLERGIAARVLVASPTTLIAILLAISHGWQQEVIAENAQRTWEAGKDLHDRVATLLDHIAKLGGALSRSVDAYNSAVASIDSRVMPAARKLESTLGPGKKGELPELGQIEKSVRVLASCQAPEAKAPAD